MERSETAERCWSQHHCLTLRPEKIQPGAALSGEILRSYCHYLLSELLLESPSSQLS